MACTAALTTCAGALCSACSTVGPSSTLPVEASNTTRGHPSPVCMSRRQGGVFKVNGTRHKCGTATVYAHTPAASCGSADRASSTRQYLPTLPPERCCSCVKPWTRRCCTAYGTWLAARVENSSRGCWGARLLGGVVPTINTAVPAC